MDIESIIGNYEKLMIFELNYRYKNRILKLERILASTYTKPIKEYVFNSIPVSLDMSIFSHWNLILILNSFNTQKVITYIELKSAFIFLITGPSSFDFMKYKSCSVFPPIEYIIIEAHHSFR